MNEINVSDLTSSDKLNSIVSNAINSLESLGYKQGTIKNYQSTWNNFLQFAKENSGDGLFSTTLTYQFLESYGIASNSDARLTFQQRHIRNVMQVLTEFALHVFSAELIFQKKYNCLIVCKKLYLFTSNFVTNSNGVP